MIHPASRFTAFSFKHLSTTTRTPETIIMIHLPPSLLSIYQPFTFTFSQPFQLPPSPSVPTSLLPVAHDRIRYKYGSVQFVDVETQVFKVHGVQEPCNNLLSLTVRAVESWVEINRRVIAVKPPPMVKHREGDISEVHIWVIFKSDKKTMGKQPTMPLLQACVFIKIRVRGVSTDWLSTGRRWRVWIWRRSVFRE